MGWPKSESPAGPVRIMDGTKNRKMKYCEGASCHETEKILDTCFLNGRRTAI